MLERFTICCFSEVLDSELMFAHYASNHRGVCLTYEIDGQNLFKITYSETLPRLSVFEINSTELLHARFLTKSLLWAYEKAWRLVLYPCQAKAWRVDTACLLEVAFGARSDTSILSTVRAWLKESVSKDVALFQCKPGRTEFAMHRHHIG
jgi:hypothetical protein